MQLREGTADIELVRRASDGDTVAVDALTERLRCIPRFLGRAARRRSERGGPADVDDLVQDTYLAVLRRLRDFRGDAAIETWACGFARIELLRRRQRDARRPRIEAVDVDTLPRKEPEAMGDQERIGRLLARVTGQAGDIARARHVEGLSFGQIAERMGASAAAVRSAYYRGLARVRGRIRES